MTLKEHIERATLRLDALTDAAKQFKKELDALTFLDSPDAQTIIREIDRLLTPGDFVEGLLPKIRKSTGLSRKTVQRFFTAAMTARKIGFTTSLLFQPTKDGD